MSHIALPNLRASLVQASYSGDADFGHLAPAIEILAIDYRLGAERKHKVAFAFFRNNANGIGARHRTKLNGKRAEPAARAPDQNIMARAQNVRTVAKEHAVGGGERQRIAGAFFPGQMLGPLHKLAILHAGKLRETAVRRLIAPDALRRREHRIAAVAFLIVAIVLIAMDHNFVADLPALYLGAHGPHDSGRVAACDVKGIFVNVDRRQRCAQRRPHAVVIDAGCHHQNQHIMRIKRPGRHHLQLHGGFRRPVSFLADRPGMHLGRDMAQRRNFADIV